MKPVYNLIKLSFTNCYLIKGRDGFLLIDCGGPGDINVFRKKLVHLGLEISRIKCLVLTHHHNDHCGLLPFLTAANPGLCVAASERCWQYLEGGRNFRPPGERYANKTLAFIMRLYLGMQKDPESFAPFCPRPGDIIVRDDNNEVLSSLGFPGNIMLTPGHTADSLSIIMEDTAFVGDAARNFLNFAGRPHYPVIYCNETSCRESREKIIGQGVRLVCPAHGRPFAVEKWR